MIRKIIEGILKDVKRLLAGFRKPDGKLDTKKILIQVAPYVLAAYFANKISYGYRISSGGDFWAKIMDLANDFGRCFRWPFPSLYINDLLIGIGGGVAFKLLVVYRKKNAKKYRKGQEHGSARWGTPKDIAPFIDPNFDNNIILTQTERLQLNGRPSSPNYARNKNVLVVGGSGSGKTRFFVKPNLMQMNASFVVTDPKGTILIEMGKLLKKGVPKLDGEGKTIKDKNGKTVYEPYNIKVFNTIDFDSSMHYNPFVYFEKEEDILKFVTNLMENTKGEGASSGEDFWVKAEQLLYVALISYIYLFAPEEEQNIGLLLDLIDASETSEEDEDFKNAVDLIFDEIEEEDPNNYALKEYKKFKLAAGKTMKSILISCAARLAPFDIPRIREITSYDEMGLDTIGEERTALFVIISDTDSTFNFLVSIMYAQLFDLLCDKALKVYHGELPIHVRFILDEFANIGKIPDFQKKISVIRSRNISASIILQSKSQLKAIYKDDMTTIIDNCDSYLFLGGSGKETLKDLEEMLGKETIDTMSTSMTKGTNESHSVNFNITGHTLKSQDEIFVMERTKCILMLSGVNPFFSDKFDITKHKRYEMLSDFDKKNEFDVYRYVHTYRKAKLKPNTQVTVIEA